MKLIRIAALFLSILGGLFLVIIITALTVRIDFSVPAPGRIEQRQMIKVRFPLAGTVSYIATNQFVKAGDTVIALDSEPEKKRLEHAVKAKTLIEAEIRKEDTPYGSPQRLYTLRRDYEQTMQDIISLSGTITQKTYAAPFAGKVIGTYVKLHDSVDTGSVVMLYADSAQFMFKSKITQRARPDVSIGGRASVKLDNFSYQTYGIIPAVVEEISSVIESNGEMTYAVNLGIVSNTVPIVEGYTGMADIVIYHGTAAGYLLHNVKK
ncbi:MAG: HlyD family efflux transporter periplasmic adaptor subunit [Spirochaetes bacterium]|nr:HlyD family efflux transporter periplasmic adaptor subunit [Spirochaetota bacterium]